MPHVQVKGTPSVEEVAPKLSGFQLAEPPLVLKVKSVYLALDRRHALAEALVVEGYLRQAFFLLLREDEDGILIRCHPACQPQKTDGVKKLIALLGRRCVELFPGSSVGNTNLSSYL